MLSQNIISRDGAQKNAGRLKYNQEFQRFRSFQDIKVLSPTDVYLGLVVIIVEISHPKSWENASFEC